MTEQNELIIEDLEELISPQYASDAVFGIVCNFIMGLIDIA